MKKTFAMLMAATSLTAVTAAPAFADDSYPNRTVRLVVGFSAGGPTDVIARILAQDMSKTLGQTVIVENRPGASSMIATREIKNAAPDGYNLLFASLGLNVNPILLGQEQAGYDPRADFTPISNAASLPLLAVNAYDAPIKTMPELVSKIKAAPEAVTFASSGNGGSGHLAGELLANMVQQKMLHVPYKGNGPALAEVMAGRVDFMFYPVIGIAQNVESKKIKILAAGTAERHPQFPDVPTMAEVGFPGFEETAPWVGMLAPANTPASIVNKLNDAMVKALAKPEIQARLAGMGATIIGDSPAEFKTFLERDHKRWSEVVKAAGLEAK